MKIAFFVSQYPTLSETFISNQVIGLKNDGHLVHIFSSNRPVDGKVHQTVIKSDLLNSTFYFERLSKSRLQKIIKLFGKSLLNIFNTNFFPLLKSIFRNDSKLSIYNFILFIDKPEYDVVHAHFGINGNYVAQLKKLGLFKRAKFITTFHGYDLSNIFAKDNYYLDLFEECKTFTVNSLYSKERLVKLNCEESKIHVLPTGLNTTLFKKKLPSENSKNQITLLFVGRLIKLKGPHLFIEICRILSQKNLLKFTAIIIGEGIMHQQLSELIEKHNLKDFVCLKGALTEEEIISLMNLSDVFVLPGIQDGDLAEAQGLVIQEAQSMELPVLISNVGGMMEGILDSVSGFALPPNDIQSFVEKIEILASDTCLRIKMGMAGRKFVEERFDIIELNKRLLDLYGNTENFTLVNN